MKRPDIASKIFKGSGNFVSICINAIEALSILLLLTTLYPIVRDNFASLIEKVRFILRFNKKNEQCLAVIQQNAKEGISGITNGCHSPFLNSSIGQNFYFFAHFFTELLIVTFGGIVLACAVSGAYFLLQRVLTSLTGKRS